MGILSQATIEKKARLLRESEAFTEHLERLKKTWEMQLLAKRKHKQKKTLQKHCAKKTQPWNRTELPADFWVKFD